MRLNPQGVEALLAIHKHGTLGGAADRLGLTQSAISQRLKQMEDLLGVMLLNRHRGKASITVTPEGERVLEIAKRYEVLMRELADAATEKHPALRIGGAHTIASYLLAPLVNDLVAGPAAPMRVSLHVAHSVDLYERLRQLELDMAYVTYQQVASGIETSLVLTEPFVVVSTLPDMPEELDIEDLPVRRQINIIYGPEYEIWARQKFGDFGLKSVMINDVRLALPILLGGEFWCIAPKVVAESFVLGSSMTIIRLRNGPPARSIYRAYRDDMSPAHEACRKVVDALVRNTLATHS